MATHAGEGDRQPGTFPGGATLHDGRTGWVLAEDDPVRALGRALAWSRQRGLDELHLVVEAGDGVLARRAGTFRSPPSVWRVEGRDLVPAVAASPPCPSPPPPAAEALVPMLAAAGADVVVEHGTVVGEVLGLEVARVEVDPGGGARLEVGVGRHDREALALVHGDLPPAEALASAVATVRRHRRLGAPPHPLNRLGAERWLRAQLMATPAVVGAAELAAVSGPRPRTNLKQPVPAIAAGTDLDRRPVVVACSVGVDLDLVPTAADARLVHDPDARLLLAVPERDDHPVTRALAAALVDPAEMATVPGDWRA